MSSESVGKPDNGPDAPAVRPRELQMSGTATVVNPERRGRTEATPLPQHGQGSTVWNRLFPTDNLTGDDAPSIASPEGIELGHFRVEERIGVGGMGAVFRAVDNRLQRVVALKVLAPAQSRDLAAVKRFRNEAKAAAQLDHDNIARVFFIGEDHGLHFIAFEFIKGTNVRDLIYERGPLDVADAMNYVLQIATALRHTAAMGVVHRDIKPSNIIITPAGRAKLVDLGLARNDTAESVDLTLAGTTLGTFDYISPEQAKDPRNVDVRSDIYSLGCTFYHMLAGEPPYPEGTVLQKLLDHQGKDPPDPAKRNRRVPEGLSAIVRKMMASDPKKRYLNPDQLIHDLTIVASQIGLRSFSNEGLVWLNAGSSRSRFWERNVGWISTVAILLVIVFASDTLSRNLQQLNSRNAETSSPQARIAEGNPESGLIEPRAVTLPATTESGSSDNNLLATTEGEGNAGVARTMGETNVRATSSGANSPVNGTSSVSPAKSGTEPKTGSTPPADSIAAKTPVEASEGGTTPPVIPFDDPDLKFASVKGDGPLSPTSAPETTLIQKPPTVAVREPAKAPSEPTVDSGPPDVRPTPLPTVSDDSAVAVIDQNGVLVKRYRTLEAACAEAEDGSVIELRFDGLRQEQPIRITKKKLVLRSGKGFEPIVEFTPRQTAADSQTRMIQISGGSLDLINLHFVLSVPSDLLVPDLSLFSLENAKQVRIQRSTVTMRNPTLSVAALFQTFPEPVPNLSDMKMMTGSVAAEPAELTISESFIRGNSQLFVHKTTMPVRLELKNTAVALDGALVQLFGDQETSGENDRLEIRLEHLTCLLGQGLVRVDSGDVPRKLIPIYVGSARNNIFLNSTASPLIAMTGNTNDEDLRRLLTWNGEKNFYDAFDVFWAFPSNQNSLNFEKWKDVWGSATEYAARNEPVLVRTPRLWADPGFDLSRMEKASLQLDDTVADNPAIGGAADGSDAGADLSKLPDFPAEAFLSARTPD